MDRFTETRIQICCAHETVCSFMSFETILQVLLDAILLENIFIFEQIYCKYRKYKGKKYFLSASILSSITCIYHFFRNVPVTRMIVTDVDLISLLFSYKDIRPMMIPGYCLSSIIRILIGFFVCFLCILGMIYI